MATSRTDQSRHLGDGSNGDRANGVQAVNLLIISKSRLHREGLGAMFGGDEAIALVGTAESAADALATWPSASYDVVLFDLAAENGIHSVRELLRERSESRIVVFGVPDAGTDTLALSEIGVAAWLTQSAGLGQAIEAIVQVATDPPRFVVSPRTSRAASRDDGVGEGRMPLTRREIEVLTLIDRGLSNREIADHDLHPFSRVDT